MDMMCTCCCLNICYTNVTPVCFEKYKRQHDTQVKDETDQFGDGLEVLGIVSMIRKCPEIMKPLFTPTKTQLNTGAFSMISRIYGTGMVGMRMGEVMMLKKLRCYLFYTRLF